MCGGFGFLGAQGTEGTICGLEWRLELERPHPQAELSILSHPKSLQASRASVYPFLLTHRISLWNDSRVLHLCSGELVRSLHILTILKCYLFCSLQPVHLQFDLKMDKESIEGTAAFWRWGCFHQWELFWAGKTGSSGELGRHPGPAPCGRGCCYIFRPQLYHFFPSIVWQNFKLPHLYL